MDVSFFWMEAGPLQTEKTIYILGAGPAGVSLSYYLSELGVKNILIEARDRVGGMARSWIWNDFHVDTGPIFFILMIKIYGICGKIYK